MVFDPDSVRRCIHQQLESDKLLGIRSAPMGKPRPTSTVSRSARRTTTTPTVDLAEKAEILRVMDDSEVKNCKKCTLCETRTQTVFGQGNPAARLVFVGEAPGSEEDKQGLAFVGRAGQLLTKMIEAMGLTRDEIFICNVLKCRPPNNRDPSADEIIACNAYLQRQIQTIDPEVLVALGAPSAKTLLQTAESIGRLRGRFHEYYPSGVPGEGRSICLMPTYHPAYLLRSPGEKAKTWADLQMVMERLGLPKKQQ